MIVNVKKTAELGRVARAKGRNYAEIDGIRIVFEDGKLEGWYNPGPEMLELFRDRTGNESMVPSEE